MKKIFSCAFLLFLFGAFLMSCTKEQIVVNELAGDWKFEEYKLNDSLVNISAFSGVTLSFEKCNQNKEDWCSMYWKYDGLPLAVEYGYRILDDGAVYEYKDLSTGTVTSGNIESHSKTSFVYNYTDANGTNRIKLKKK